MKVITLIVPVVLLTSGCAYPTSGVAPFAPARTPSPYAPPSSPVGRWDNVMMLEPGTPIRVLWIDGPGTIYLAK